MSLPSQHCEDIARGSRSDESKTRATGGIISLNPPLPGLPLRGGVRGERERLRSTSAYQPRGGLSRAKSRARRSDTRSSWRASRPRRRPGEAALRRLTSSASSCNFFFRRAVVFLVLQLLVLVGRAHWRSGGANSVLGRRSEGMGALASGAPLDVAKSVLNSSRTGRLVWFMGSPAWRPPRTTAR